MPTIERLRMAGLLSFGACALAIPQWLGRAYLIQSENTAALLLAVLLALAFYGVLIYLYEMLRAVLVSGLDDQGYSPLVRALIALTLFELLFEIAAAVFGLGGTANGEAISFSNTTVLLLGLGGGVIKLLLAVKLFGAFDRYPILKPFSYVLLVEAVCALSVILLPLTLVIRLFVMILMGRVFMEVANLQLLESGGEQGAG